MSLKTTLTNETLNKRFENPFALVNYAISLAKAKISRGEEQETNPVLDVLENIASNQDIIDSLEDEDEIEEEVVV